jgi:hypothetical protein
MDNTTKKAVFRFLLPNQGVVGLFVYYYATNTRMQITFIFRPPHPNGISSTLICKSN